MDKIDSKKLRRLEQDLETKYVGYPDKDSAYAQNGEPYQSFSITGPALADATDVFIALIRRYENSIQGRYIFWNTRPSATKIIGSVPGTDGYVITARLLISPNPPKQPA